MGLLVGVMAVWLAVFQPVSAAPTSTDVLTGTWQVTKTCVSGCAGTTVATERVHRVHSHVFMATGTTTVVLYRLGSETILVHSAVSSSLLTIQIPGQMMKGRGVTVDGGVFITTWRCVPPAQTFQASGRVSLSRSNPSLAGSITGAENIC
jgi:hypothetical protein